MIQQWPLTLMKIKTGKSDCGVYLHWEQTTIDGASSFPSDGHRDMDGRNITSRHTPHRRVGWGGCGYWSVCEIRYGPLQGQWNFSTPHKTHALTPALQVVVTDFFDKPVNWPGRYCNRHHMGVDMSIWICIQHGIILQQFSLAILCSKSRRRFMQQQLKWTAIIFLVIYLINITSMLTAFGLPVTDGMCDSLLTHYCHNYMISWRYIFH